MQMPRFAGFAALLLCCLSIMASAECNVQRFTLTPSKTAAVTGEVVTFTMLIQPDAACMESRIWVDAKNSEFNTPLMMVQPYGGFSDIGGAYSNVAISANGTTLFFNGTASTPGVYTCCGNLQFGALPGQTSQCATVTFARSGFGNAFELPAYPYTSMTYSDNAYYKFRFALGKEYGITLAPVNVQVRSNSALGLYSPSQDLKANISASDWPESIRFAPEETGYYYLVASGGPFIITISDLGPAPTPEPSPTPRPVETPAPTMAPTPSPTPGLQPTATNTPIATATPVQTLTPVQSPPAQEQRGGPCGSGLIILAAVPACIALLGKYQKASN